MKAITIKQPWASLIVGGIKDVENRTWTCPEKYIGQRILIHAGMEKTNGLIDNYLNYEQRKSFREMFGFSGLDFIEPTGAIIGSVQIVDCVINHKSVWAEKTTQMSPENTYNWVLANPTKFDTPIPCKGKLRFWEYEDKNINFK